MKLLVAKRFAALSMAFFGAVVALIGAGATTGQCVDYAANSGKAGSCTTEHPYWPWSIFGLIVIALSVRLWVWAKK